MCYYNLGVMNTQQYQKLREMMTFSFGTHFLWSKAQTLMKS
jgi:hypothetical protein